MEWVLYFLGKYLAYALAFWLFGWKWVGRKPAPALGWALMGALARGVGGVILGSVLLGVLLKVAAPLWGGIVALLLLRFLLWAVLAGFLYSPQRKPLLVFSLVMTLLNVVADFAMVGLPNGAELTAPLRF